MEELTLLILGAGWTAEFLIPLLQSRNIPFAATTTSGRSVAGVPTLPFKFDPAAPEPDTRSAIAALPRARYILITFPLVGKGQSKLLVETYHETHLTAAATTTAAGDHPFRFLQLGSTGIWQQRPGASTDTSPNSNGNSDSDSREKNSPWLTRHSPYRTSDPRAVAEDELLALGGCVLNLSGLWGGSRHPRHLVGRVAGSKDAVRQKTSIHLIHGADVARAIAAVVQAGDGRWERAASGQRWMLTDGFVYDWWALLAGWAESGEEGAGAEPSEQARWVWELMAEEGVRALPRGMKALGRCYDVREFWETFGLVPLKGRV
ncbi:hypothetical protein MMYC01_208396 [Madurella mycetomatis]|uniref:Uncharacterized protein n=1 Tax=Madurella mycetomatis TaxID=100816 RepID=A0A175VWD0_9PEZI|nr:hypothetical protein MMYC01_208396 [Madurella mycetomatis]